MADTILSSSSRRERDRLRQERRRRAVKLAVSSIAVAALAVAGVLVATDVLRPGEKAPRLAGAENRADSSALPQIRTLAEQHPPRPLSHEDPLRLWVGGDSLAGSVGPALGEIAGETGIVDTQVDYRVSSGIASNGVRNWPDRAAQEMAQHDPEAVVFVIGTNDASIVSNRRNDDGVYEWEPRYRIQVARMMDLLVGGEKHRTVMWVGAPTMKTKWRDDSVVELNRVMREEADLRDDVIYVDAYSLFAGSNGGYAESLADADGDIVRVRNQDGVHFTPAGADRLAGAVYALLDARWNIDDQAVPDQPIRYSLSAGSGGGGGSGSGSSGTGTGDTVVDDTVADGSTTTVTTSPPVTDPPATAPPATPATTTTTTTTTTTATTTTAAPTTTTDATIAAASEP